VQRWGKYDVLLLDDPLQGASDARVTDALKDLIAYRQDWKRPNIITSQIGGDDYKEQSAKFGKETKADKEVIEALLRRMRETCRVVPFQSLAANNNRQETEEAF
jgi:DNA replication protein DnaC